MTGRVIFFRGAGQGAARKDRRGDDGLQEGASRQRRDIEAAVDC